MRVPKFKYSQSNDLLDKCSGADFDYLSGDSGGLEEGIKKGEEVNCLDQSEESNESCCGHHHDINASHDNYLNIPVDSCPDERRLTARSFRVEGTKVKMNRLSD